MAKKPELSKEEIEIGRIQNKISIVQLENRISSLEKVVESIHSDLKEINEVLKMHIRFHMSEYQPVEMYRASSSGTIVTYQWGNYYRVAFNAKTEEVQPE